MEGGEKLDRKGYLAETQTSRETHKGRFTPMLPTDF